MGTKMQDTAASGAWTRAQSRSQCRQVVQSMKVLGHGHTAMCQGHCVRPRRPTTGLSARKPAEKWTIAQGFLWTKKQDIAAFGASTRVQPASSEQAKRERCIWRKLC